MAAVTGRMNSVSKANFLLVTDFTWINEHSGCSASLRKQGDLVFLYIQGIGHTLSTDLQEV